MLNELQINDLYTSIGTYNKVFFYRQLKFQPTS